MMVCNFPGRTSSTAWPLEMIVTMPMSDLDMSYPFRKYEGLVEYLGDEKLSNNLRDCIGQE